MKITVCIGSSCHIKGARQVIEQLQNSIARYKLKDQVELSGSNCMGDCQEGVCVSVDGKLFSVSPENLYDFWESQVMSQL